MPVTLRGGDVLGEVERALAVGTRFAGIRLRSPRQAVIQSRQELLVAVLAQQLVDLRHLQVVTCVRRHPELRKDAITHLKARRKLYKYEIEELTGFPAWETRPKPDQYQCPQHPWLTGKPCPRDTTAPHPAALGEHARSAARSAASAAPVRCN